MQDSTYEDCQRHCGYSLVSEAEACADHPVALTKKTCKRPRKFESLSRTRDAGQRKKKKLPKKGGKKQTLQTTFTNSDIEQFSNTAILPDGPSVTKICQRVISVPMATSNAHSPMSPSVSVVELIPQSTVNPSKSDVQVSRGESFDTSILQDLAMSMSTLLMLPSSSVLPQPYDSLGLASEWRENIPNTVVT